MKYPKQLTILTGCFLLSLAASAQTTFLSVDANAGTSPSPTQSGFTGMTAGVGTDVGPFTTSFTGLSTAYTATGTVGLTMTFPSTNYTTRDRTATPANTGNFTYSSLYRDIWISSSNGGNLVLSFSGMLPDTAYQIRFYAYDNTAAASRTMIFTDWTSGSAGTGAATGSVTYTAGSTFTGAAGDNYLYSTLITAMSNSSGNISIRETTGGSYSSIFNGFEFAATADIPEPSTYGAVCGALGLAGAAFARRRMRG